MPPERKVKKYMRRIRRSLCAAVLAGGLGKRLFPITETMPKPLVPIAGRTALERILDKLPPAGISRAAVTTMYMPEQIEALTHPGLTIRFFRERTPLGTAGSVRSALEFLDGTVVVLAGDAVFDFSLLEAAESHFASGAGVTIVLTAASDPTEYGIVLEQDGRVERFLEKPAWRETFSDQINSGIYFIERQVLEQIPEGVFYDFSKDLFPLLLSRGEEIHTFRAQGYWCDIGSPEAFRKCCLHYSGGETVSAGAVTGEGTSARSSVLFEGVRSGKNCVLDGCTVCENTLLGDGVTAERGSCIGANCVIGDGARICANVRVASGTRIKKGAVIMENIYSSAEKQCLFSDGGRLLNDTPEPGARRGGDSLLRAMRLGHAAGHFAGGRGVAVMHDGSEYGEAVSRAFSLGACSAGASALLLGEGFLSLCSFACRLFSPALAFFASQDDCFMLNRRGLPVNRSDERKIEGLFFSRAEDGGVFAKEHDLSCLLRNRYFRHLLSRTLPVGRNAFVETVNRPSMFLRTALLRRARPVPAGGDGLRIHISSDGKSAFAVTDGGAVLSFWHLAGALLRAQAGYGRRDFLLPLSCPDAVVSMITDTGCTVSFYDENGTGNDKDSAARIPMLLDGPTAAAEFLAYLDNSGLSADDVAESMPRFFLRSAEIVCDEDKKSARIAALAKRCGVENGRVRVRTDRGTVTVSPLFYGGFRLTAEAATSEIASELCDFVGKSLADAADGGAQDKKPADNIKKDEK